MADLNQMESLPQAPNLQQIGFSGLARFRGLITEEYLTDLRGVKKIETYQKMRSDGMIEALLSATTLPVIAASWAVEPAGEDGPAKKAAELVERQLFERLGCCWEEEVRKLLTYLQFGFSVSAKNWKIEGGEVVLSELRALHPKTLVQGGKNWQFGPNGELEGVWQAGHDGNSTWRTEFIPKRSMLHLVRNGDFGDPEGRSLLRSAYKHWLVKDSLYRYQAIGLERGAVGTIIAKYPQGTSAALQSEAQDFIEQVQVSDTGGGTFEAGWEFENLSVDVKTEDIMAAIHHHDAEIAKSVLAQFLNLGQEGAGGAYALSADQTDLFLLSLASIGDYVAARVNRDVIPEMVAYNFGPQEQYPRLSCTVARRSAAQLATLLTPLLAGTNPALTWGEADEDHLREYMELPPRTEERPARVEPTPPGQPGEKPQQQSRRERIELHVFQDPPQFRGEEPAYPELGEVAQQFHGALVTETRRFKARVWKALGLPPSEALETHARTFNNPPEQSLTEAQRRALDEAISRFIAEVFGDRLTEAGFVELPEGDGAEDALLQSYLRLGHSVGVRQATRLTGAVPAASVTRDSPQVKRVLTDAFKRLTQHGKKKLGHQLNDVRELLAERSLVGRNPFDVAKELEQALQGLERHEWERLARTEMAFAANQGSVDEYAAEGVKEVENLVSALACPVCAAHAGKRVKVKDAVVGLNIAPFHPHCLDSVIPVVE